MKATELIQQLVELVAYERDLRVTFTDSDGDVHQIQAVTYGHGGETFTIEAGRA